MKKLELAAESLTVESFSTADIEEQVIGTVEAREMFATRPIACDPFSVPPRCS